jgi:hypothetical protein
VEIQQTIASRDMKKNVNYISCYHIARSNYFAMGRVLQVRTITLTEDANILGYKAVYIGKSYGKIMRLYINAVTNQKSSLFTSTAMRNLMFTK